MTPQLRRLRELQRITGLMRDRQLADLAAASRARSAIAAQIDALGPAAIALGEAPGTAALPAARHAAWRDAMLGRLLTALAAAESERLQAQDAAARAVGRNAALAALIRRLGVADPGRD